MSLYFRYTGVLLFVVLMQSAYSARTSWHYSEPRKVGSWEMERLARNLIFQFFVLLLRRLPRTHGEITNALDLPTLIVCRHLLSPADAYPHLCKGMAKLSKKCFRYISCSCPGALGNWRASNWQSSLGLQTLEDGKLEEFQSSNFPTFTITRQSAGIAAVETFASEKNSSSRSAQVD